jgi:hypothetical protein
MTTYRIALLLARVCLRVGTIETSLRLASWVAGDMLKREIGALMRDKVKRR